MKLRRIIAAAALTAATLPAWVGTASAEPGEGATVTTRRECVPTPTGEVCFNTVLVVNETTTPSGNVSYVANHHAVIENNSFGCQFVGESRTHQHFLVKDGELQEQGTREESSLTMECPGRPGTVCTFTVHYHFANDTIQYDRGDFVCTEV
jgi:hypothetical protein